MKCVICKSPDIQKKIVDEEIKVESDIILVSVEVLVCSNCGERYYDNKTMRQLEETKLKLSTKNLKVQKVGKVFRTKVA